MFKEPTTPEQNRQGQPMELGAQLAEMKREGAKAKTQKTFQVFCRARNAFEDALLVAGKKAGWDSDRIITAMKSVNRYRETEKSEVGSNIIDFIYVPGVDKRLLIDLLKEYVSTEILYWNALVAEAELAESEPQK